MPPSSLTAGSRGNSTDAFTHGSSVIDTEGDEMEEHQRGLGYLEEPSPL